MSASSGSHKSTVTVASSLQDRRKLTEKERNTAIIRRTVPSKVNTNAQGEKYTSGLSTFNQLNTRTGGKRGPLMGDFFPFFF